MLMLMLQMLYILCQRILLFHSRKDSLAIQHIPGGSYDNRTLVILSDNVQRLLQLMLLCRLRMRENYAGCVLDLISEEFAEVLHIHLAFIRINNGGEAIKLRILTANGRSCLDNVGELSNARGLDNNSVGMVFLKHFAQRLREISNERAADAAGVHLCDLNTCISKETAVNADLAEFIFDKHEFLARVSLFNELFYKSSFSCSEKAGENINLCHI